MQDLKLTYFRYRVFYSKSGVARFIGHLDLQSLFAKALKRAKLPVAYSQGFNPHQLLSIAMPLSLGIAGHREIFEIFLTGKIDEVVMTQILDAQMPKGIKIIEVQEVSNIGKSAAGLISGAIYWFTFPYEIEGIVPLEIGESNIVIKQIAPNCIEATLPAGSKKNIKPQVFIEQIIESLGLQIEPKLLKYERVGLLL